MNTTSVPGCTLVARSMSTASFIDALRLRWGAKLSTAHWMILEAGRCSNSRLSSASSASVKSGISTSVTGWTSSVVTSDRGARCRPVTGHCASGRSQARSRSALRVAGLGHVRTGLAVVDVVLGAILGRGELVEVAQVLGDRLHATGPVDPRAEHLARLALVVVAA